MKSGLLIILFIFCSSSIQCQEKLIANQKFQGLTQYDCKRDSVSDVNNFPELIKFKSLKLLKHYTGEFYDSIHFLTGQIIDLKELSDKKVFSDTSSFYFFESNNIIPKYELFFILSDKSINIDQLIIKISFDEYGQILEFHWPFYINKKVDFLSSDKVMNDLRQRTIDFKGKAPDDILVRYDELLKNFVWEFVYHFHNDSKIKGLPLTSTLTAYFVVIKMFIDFEDQN